MQLFSLFGSFVFLIVHYSSQFWLLLILIIIVGFIEHKIDTNPLMCLSPRRDSPETDMGRHLKSTRQGITKVGGMPA